MMFEHEFNGQPAVPVASLPFAQRDLKIGRWPGESGLAMGDSGREGGTPLISARALGLRLSLGFPGWAQIARLRPSLGLVPRETDASEERRSSLGHLTHLSVVCPP